MDFNGQTVHQESTGLESITLERKCFCGAPEIQDDQNEEGFVNFPENSKLLRDAL